MVNLSSIAAQATFQTATFTSSALFVVPQGVTAILVTMAAGGGGAVVGSCGGGSGGFYVRYPLRVIPGETLAVTVGTGGAQTVLAAANAWVYASKGGASQVLRGSTVLLAASGGGGAAAQRGSSSSASTSHGGNGGWPNGSGGGADSATTVTRGGGCGTSNSRNSAGSGHGGATRPSQGSGMFQGVDRIGGRTAVYSYGAGGDGLSAAAADGKPGIVIIQYFI